MKRTHLNVRGIEHDTKTGAEGFWWEVVLEFGCMDELMLVEHVGGIELRGLYVRTSHDTRVAYFSQISIELHGTPIESTGGHTMWPCDLSPDHPDLGSPDLLLSTVDESYPLAQVETSLRRVTNTL